MNTVKISLFFVGILCLIACTNQTVVGNLSDRDSSTTTICIDEVKPRTELNYSEIYSRIEYVELESETKARIGTIDKIEFTKERDYVVFDSANGIIARFNSHGKYLNNIGERGHGPNEYIHPEIVVYDEFHDKIIVYDGSKKSLLHFNIDGTINGITKLHKYIDNFIVIDNSHIAIYANYRDILGKNDVAYNLEVIDFEGNIILQYDEYSVEKMNFRPDANNVFSFQNNKLYFHKYYYPTIYSVTAHEVKPLYFIDFKSNQIPMKWLKYNKTEEIEDELSQHKDKAYFTSFYDGTNKYIIKAILGSGDIVYVFVDKKCMDKQKYGQIFVNDFMGILTPQTFFYNQNQMLGVIYPEFIHHYSDIIKDKEKCRLFKEYYMNNHGYKISDLDCSILDKLSKSTNPIIQVCTLK